MPTLGLVYGTAWKEDQTESLTLLALEQGFRAIDTANQRRHYHEAGVGKAIRRAISAGWLTRGQLFLQTKFTFVGGQDHRLPYDPKAPIAEQVAQSFASSLDHLGVDRLDSYVLHGPSRRQGLGPDDWSAWQAMELLHDTGATAALGVSNVTLEQLKLLFASARIKPQFVQNRCYANRGWDRDVRKFCAENAIGYQGFSLLTANRDVVAHPYCQQLAQRYGRTTSAIIFRFALDIGMIPLTGTTNPEHMRDDLKVTGFNLAPEEISQIERLAVG